MRKGDWISTYTGIKFWPLDARLEEISIVDIAHSLSNICRFGGHVQKFYSVAQHSVYCSYQVKPENALFALLHDGSEAYLGDCVRPLKPFLTNFQTIEDNLLGVIANKFNFLINDQSYKDIKCADEILLFTEARDLMQDSRLNWKGKDKIIPLDLKIIPWSSDLAEEKFLYRFYELTSYTKYAVVKPGDVLKF